LIKDVECDIGGETETDDIEVHLGDENDKFEDNMFDEETALEEEGVGSCVDDRTAETTMMSPDPNRIESRHAKDTVVANVPRCNGTAENPLSTKDIRVFVSTSDCLECKLPT